MSYPSIPRETAPRAHSRATKVSRKPAGKGVFQKGRKRRKGQKYRCRRFFETKAEAEKFILQVKRRGSVQLADLSIEEMHILGVIRQSENYEPSLLFGSVAAV